MASRVTLDRGIVRVDIVRRAPVPLIRHCIGALLFVVIAVSGYGAFAAQSPETLSPEIAKLNHARERHHVNALDRLPSLDDLANRFLQRMLEDRSLTPAGYGEIGNRVLSEDIAAAIGEDGLRYRYAGIVVAYGIDLNHAMDVAVATRANGPALYDPALEHAGIASSTIPAREPWIAPPPGGFGRDVELAGQTLVVIVTAGTSRAGSQ